MPMYTTSAWNSWNDGTSATTGAAASNGVWYTWTNNTASTATATSDVWYTWQDQPTTMGAGTCDGTPVWNGWVQGTIIVQQQRELTKEEIKRLEEQRLEQQRLAEVARKQAEEDAKQRKIAEEKALQLLLENLEENQAEIFKKTGAIPVVARSGRRYSIRKGTSGNVDELDGQTEKAKARLCFHPIDYSIPVYDVMLAQKLMLETSEDEARKIANISNYS